LSPALVQVINSLAPWFVTFFIFIILVIMMFKLLGVSDSEIAGTIKRNVGIQWAVVIAALILLAFGFGGVFGQKAGPYLDEQGVPIQESPGAVGASGGTGAGQSTGAPGSTGTSSFQYNLQATLFHPVILGLIVVLLICIAAVGLLTGYPAMRK